MKSKQFSAMILSFIFGTVSFSNGLATKETIASEVMLSDSSLEVNSGAVIEESESVTNEVIQFAGGDGTEENPYQVATAEQLDAVRNDLNAYYIQTADIDLEGIEWIPIGYNTSSGETNTFAGTYDGNGYEIFNLSITELLDEITYIGLFAYCDGGTLHNISLKNLTIEFEILDERVIYIGSIVGITSWYQGEIYNCNSSGNINVIESTNAGGSYIGGITGYVGNISYCTFSGSINFSGIYTAADYLGGIAGYARYAEHCINYADINADGLEYISGKSCELYCGGIAGSLSNGYIECCINYGSVAASTHNPLYCGGVTGYNNSKGSVSYCINFGNISGKVTEWVHNGYYTSKDVSNIGGIVGLNYHGVNVHDCINWGNITASESAGGLVGYSPSNPNFGRAWISNGYNLGNAIVGSSANRIVGKNGYVMSNNYSIDTTTVNGEIPNESETGADTNHGESMSEDDILEAIQYIFDYIYGSLEVESVDYECDIIKTAADSILAGTLSASDLKFEVKVKFNHEILLTSGDNIWLLPDVEGEIVLPDNRPSAECIDIDDYHIEKSAGTADTLVIDVPINNFYDGISYLMGKTLTLYVDCNVIEPSDDNIQFDSLTFEIDTKNYDLNYSEDVFGWDNSNTNFGCEHYDISSSLASRLNIDSTALANYRYTMEWDGSCFGMSGIVGMTKNGYFSLDNIITNNKAENVKGLPRPVNSTGKLGVRDWVNYVQLLQYDEDIKSNYHTTFYVKGFFKGLTNIYLGTSCKDGLQAVVNNAKNNPTKYILTYAYDENGVDKAHSILPFYCYNDDEELMYRIVCYDCAASDYISVVSVDYDYSSCKISRLDSDVTSIRFTNLSGLEDKCEAGFSLTKSQAEEFYLYLRSLPEFKLLFDTGVIIYKDGEFSGDTDLIKGVDIYSYGEDYGAVIKFTIEDFENCTVTTDSENLYCNIVSPCMSSYSSLKGTDLSVTFNVSDGIVSSEGNIKEYSQALAYDDKNTVIARGTDEMKIVMVADDEMSVSTESRGNVSVDFIVDGEYIKTEEANSNNGITIIDDGSELQIYENSGTTSLMGDIDGDGVLTSKDAVLLLRYLSEITTFTNSQLSIADYNEDEQINMIDVIGILQSQSE